MVLYYNSMFRWLAIFYSVGFLQIWPNFYGVSEGQLWRLVPSTALLNFLTIKSFTSPPLTWKKNPERTKKKLLGPFQLCGFWLTCTCTTTEPLHCGRRIVQPLGVKYSRSIFTQTRAYHLIVALLIHCHSSTVIYPLSVHLGANWVVQSIISITELLIRLAPVIHLVE